MLGRLALAVFLVLALACATAAPALARGSSESPLVVLLDLKHPRGLDGFVRSVSDPDSPRYRDYRSVGALVSRYGATKRDRRAALRWLARRGIEGEVGPTGVWVTARTDAATAARLFSTPARARGRMHAAAGAVPAGLRGEVTGVSVLGTAPGYARTAAGVQTRAIELPPSPESSMRERTGTPEGCAEGVNAGNPAPYSAFTPNQYLTAYGHADLHARGIRGKGQRAALVEIDGFNPSDIAAFGACFGITIPPIRTHLVGIPAPLAPGGETTLDLEILSAGAPGLERIDVYEGGDSMADLFLTFAEALGTKRTRPDVISISIGNCEAVLAGDRRFWRGLGHVASVASGAGISVFVASGDSGSSLCTIDDRQSALPLLSVNPYATPSHVTAVGGTNVTLDAENQLIGEIPWNDSPDLFAAGGGGLSILVDDPWWQKPGISGADAGGSRATPDVAALADVIPGYAINCSAGSAGECTDDPSGWMNIGGTSVATPLTAAGVALANQRAAKRGQPPLGFVNPLLYDLGGSKAGSSLFFDIVTGNNDLGTMIPVAQGGGAPLGCCSAAPGYDLATGWGSMDVARLSALAVKAAKGG